MMHNSVLPSIASFKTSSYKDYGSSDPKYKKKTDMSIPSKCNELN